MTWTYKRTEAELWTVGHYTPDGVFEAESDHPDAKAAAARVHWLHGGLADEDVNRRLAQLTEQVEALIATTWSHTELLDADELRLDEHAQKIEVLTSGLTAAVDLTVRAQRRIGANEQRVGLLIGSLFDAASSLLGTQLRMNALAEQIAELQEAPGA
jgi:folylpolyglutamate synthase/dihydropteroate synthase